MERETSGCVVQVHFHFWFVFVENISRDGGEQVGCSQLQTPADQGLCFCHQQFSAVMASTRLLSDFLTSFCSHTQTVSSSAAALCVQKHMVSQRCQFSPS